MSRLFDFSISTPRNRSTTSAECAVVVNNTIHPPPKDVQVQYPGSISFPPPPEVTARSIITEDPKEIVIYKAMVTCFKDILQHNDQKLIANLLDQSGKIIIDGASLINLIAILTDIPETSITLRCSVETTGCTAKISKISNIEEIKVGALDFKLGYNEKFNQLTENFGISLRKVFKVT
jgi:hypothetical protein